MYRHVSTCTLAHKSQGYLTWDATSRQAADNGRNIQTAQDPLKALTHSNIHMYTLTKLHLHMYRHVSTCTLAHKSQGYLTWDATSRQAADNGRNIQTAQDPLKALTHSNIHMYTLTKLHLHMYRHVSTCTLAHKSQGYLTWDATSRQAADNGRNIQTAQDPLKAFTHSHIHMYTLTKLHMYTYSQISGVPDLRRNISTGCWQRTQHPDSTRPSQSFNSQLHTHVHTHKIALTHVQTCINMYTRSQISGYLTWDTTYRQAADNRRNIQTAQDPLKAFTHSHIHVHMYTLTKKYRSYTYTLNHKAWGTWLEDQFQIYTSVHLQLHTRTSHTRFHSREYSYMYT